MSIQKDINKTNNINIIKDESILVVKRQELFSEADCWQGISQVDFANYLNIIKNKKEFLPRSLMEQDFSYKQIIPYLVFVHEDKLFLMQRQNKASESRLKNKYTFGIGGHIRHEDMSTDSIIDWSKREFHEEVEYKEGFYITPIGIINDDSNDVGKVHLGFVLLLRGDSADIKIKSELKNGRLLSFDECQEYYDDMESWSQMVFDFLKKNKI